MRAQTLGVPSHALLIRRVGLISKKKPSEENAINLCYFKTHFETPHRSFLTRAQTGGSASKRMISRIV